MAELSVLVISYNTRELTVACLASVLASRDGLDVEVVVVDNASTDGTLDVVRERFPDVQAIAAGENLGFARAANLAAGGATGELLLLLNPDATVHPETLSTLVGFARRHPHHGLYGGKNLWPDGRLNATSCRSLPTLWSVLCFATGASTVLRGSHLFDPESLGDWKRDTVRSVGMLSGSLMLAHREAWTRLGGFDERFFMYGEDTDLSLRARKLGYDPVFVPDAVVTHVVGASSPSTRRIILRLTGRATYIRKHWSPVRRRLGLALLQLGVGARALGGSALRLTGRSTGGEAWGEAWAARRDWRLGYPPASSRLG